MTKLPCLFLCLLSLLFSGCNYEHRHVPDPSEMFAGQSEVVTFNALRTIILGPHCLRCHSGPEPAQDIDLSSYNKILESGLVKTGKPELSDLYLIVEQGVMPPKAPLSAVEKKWIYLWIEDGAHP